MSDPGKRNRSSMSKKRRAKAAGQSKSGPAPKPKRRVRWGIVLTALVVVGGSVTFGLWYGLRKPQAPPDILLISIDTLRADRLGCYGYRAGRTPTIDRMAAESAVFDAVVAPLPVTLPSHASMLTGLIPPRHGVRVNEAHRLADRHVTLAEALKADGYQTGAFVGALPMAKAGGLDQGFSVYDDELSSKRLEGRAAVARQERYAEEVLAVAQRWLRSTDPTRPVFAFIHLYDPHAPYEKPAPGTGAPGYDGEVAHVDKELGSFFSTLKRDARWSNLLTVVTSDHGEGLGEHSEKSHGVFVYESTLRVPLIAHWPGSISPRRVAQPVGLIDIPPTLLELAAAPPLPGIDGKSLSPLLKGAVQEDRSFYFESLLGEIKFGWAPLRGMRDGDLKYIAAPRPELYDLASDPHELTNLHAQRPRDAARLAAYLDAVGRGTRETSEVDEETLAALATLGYVSAPPVDTANLADRPDPKDLIEIYDRYQDAHMVFAAGRTDEALTLMESLEASFEHSPLFYYRWGNWAAAGEHWDRAAGCFQKSLTLDALNQSAHMNLAAAYLNLGEAEKSLEQFKVLLKLNPDHVKAHLYSGLIYADSLGHPQGAVSHWTRFLELAPNHPQADTVRKSLAAAQAP